MADAAAVGHQSTNRAAAVRHELTIPAAAVGRRSRPGLASVAERHRMLDGRFSGVGRRSRGLTAVRVAPLCIAERLQDADGVKVALACPVLEAFQRAEHYPIVAVALRSELPAAERSEGHAEVATLEGDDGFAESPRVPVEHCVDGLRGVLYHVVGDPIEIADRADVDVEGVAGDLMPGVGQVALMDPGARAEHVQVGVPSVGLGLVLDLDEGNATVDRVYPERLSSKSAERLDQSIDLMTQRRVTVSKGEGDQPDFETFESTAKVRRDDPRPIALARSAPAIAAGVGADLDPVGVGDGAVDPGGVAAGAEATEAFGPWKNRLQG